MVLHINNQSNLFRMSRNNRVSGRMNRYTGKETKITNDTCGEERYVNTRRDPRRKRKDQLWIRLYRYMTRRPAACMPAGSPVWRTMQSAGTMNPVM